MCNSVWSRDIENVGKPSSEVYVDLGASISRNVEFPGYTPDTCSPNCRSNLRSQSVSFWTPSLSIPLGIYIEKTALMMSPCCRLAEERMADWPWTRAEDGERRGMRIADAIQTNNILKFGMRFEVDCVFSSWTASRKPMDSCPFPLRWETSAASLAVKVRAVTFPVLSIPFKRADWSSLTAESTSAHRVWTLLCRVA